MLQLITPLIQEVLQLIQLPLSFSSFIAPLILELELKDSNRAYFRGLFKKIEPDFGVKWL
jgi:hypothetical protein